MTTYRKFEYDGDIIEVRTNVGAAPIITRNGVVDTSLNITDFSWDHDLSWQSVRIWWPRQINGRWYMPGSRVFRRLRLSSGGSYWHYGDEFDLLKAN